MPKVEHVHDSIPIIKVSVTDATQLQVKRSGVLVILTSLTHMRSVTSTIIVILVQVHRWPS